MNSITPSAADAAEAAGQSALRAEVEMLFRSDMDRFTGIALERRARKSGQMIARAA